jgi:hypothetical protein
VSFLLRVAAVCGPKGAAGPDVTAPALVNAVIPVAGTTLQINFTESVKFGAGGNTGFTIAMSGGAVTLTYSSGENTSTLIYTTSRTVNTGETCSDFDYTQPTNGVEDQAGNDLASFLNQQALVTNNADTTAPTLSNVTDIKTGTTTATITVDTNEGNGTLYWAVSTNTTRSNAQIKAGTGCAQFSSEAVSSTGTKTVNVTGLSANTTYYAHFTQDDAAANTATAVNGDGFTTDAVADSTAPVLSSPVDTAASDTTATLSVDTDEGNGTLYWVVSTSASAPSKAQVKAGQMHTGAAAADSGNQAVSGTGTQSISGGATGLTAETAYTAHFMHEDSSTNQSDVSSGDGFTTEAASSYEAESETLFAAMTSEPDATRKGHIDTLVAALKTAGVWTQLDRLYVLAAHDSQAARLDWIAPGTDTLTATNTPTFTTDQGYTGNGSNARLDGATAVNTYTNYALNDAHIGLWSLTNAQSSNMSMGTTSGTQGTHINPRTASDATQARLNSGFTNHNAASQTDSRGHYVMNRVDGTNAQQFRNGASILGPSALSASGEPSGAIQICAGNGSASSLQIALAHVGGGLSSTEISDMYDAFTTYLTAVGAI